MGLPLPVALIPTIILAGSTNLRVTGYRFELYDKDEVYLGTLRGVKKGGEIAYDAYASVKSTGTLEVADLGQGIDWLNVRIKPVVLVSNGVTASEAPLGMFTCAAPVAAWDSTGRSWRVELTDKLGILDTDIAMSDLTNSVAIPVTYTAPAGSNVLEVVKALILETGETVEAIGVDDKLLSSPITWDVGTTRLRIINDLLDAINYFSLYCDGNGAYRCEPYVGPLSRSPVYSDSTPFNTDGPTQMSPEWGHDENFYGVPNRYVVISQGSGDTPGMVAVATNTSLQSPFSYNNRGRWITQTETGVEAASQEDLDLIAARRLSNATSVTSTIEVKHAFLPELTFNSTVRFKNAAAGIDTTCAVIVTRVPFDATGLCSSTLRDVG